MGFPMLWSASCGIPPCGGMSGSFCPSASSLPVCIMEHNCLVLFESNMKFVLRGGGSLALK
jgi:hypothetical protein